MTGETVTANPKPAAGYLRIATEEAWAPPELLEGFRRVLEEKRFDDPGFESLWGFYLTSTSERLTSMRERIQNLGERRIADMNAAGIDQQLLLLTAPGVQVFDAATAVSLARATNDQLADAIRRFPTRLAGLAAIAPQDPAAAAKELERGVHTLGLKGAVINSHTRGEFLDDAKFWDIFAAAEALDVPIYIHPSGPPPAMVRPFLERGLEGAIFGFAVEVALHVLRIVVSGAFDRFPRLKIVIGHTGEGLPFWMSRLDYMHRASMLSQRYATMPPLQRKPSDYIRDNLYVTSSGVAWEPSVMFCHRVMGPDHVLYAMDYPYQYVVEEVAAMDALPLSAEDKKKFFQTNAEGLFKL